MNLPKTARFDGYDDVNYLDATTRVSVDEDGGACSNQVGCI